MQQEIVIDTNIWVKAMVDAEYDSVCDDALHSFFLDKEMQLALDYNGEIEREYRDNIRDNRPYEIRMNQLEREQRKCWRDSGLTEKQKNDLEKRGFHEPEDHVFVGTAMHAGKMIMTEDSDYGVHGEEDKQQVYDYMKNDMELSVFSSQQFLESRYRNQ